MTAKSSYNVDYLMLGVVVLNERELETYLHDALISATAKRYQQLPKMPPEYPPKYKRGFKKMLADPFSYAKKCRRSAVQKISRYALVAVLALAILTGVVFAIPQTRTIAVDLIRQWFSDHVTFTYSEGNDHLTLPEVEINYIPEGYHYAEDASIEHDGFFQIAGYLNDDKDLITVDTYILSKHVSTSINTEHSKISYVKLDNGIEAQLFEAESAEWTSSLVWISKDGKIFYMVQAKLPPEELLKIANNIVFK